MRREILFKGTTLQGETVRGFLVNEETIRISSGLDRTVIRSTVGQYIGLEDKNDNKIFEKDLVHVVLDKFGKGKHEYWRIEYGSFGDAQFYVTNDINSCRAIECVQSVWFTIDGKDEILLEIIKE
jgi:uncharacterized phage protein (TIGR01671 family)